MISGFVLLCLSWLQILFERQEINVREKPSSSACHPVNTVQLRTQDSNSLECVMCTWKIEEK